MVRTFCRVVHLLSREEEEDEGTGCICALIFEAAYTLVAERGEDQESGGQDPSEFVFLMKFYQVAGYLQVAYRSNLRYPEICLVFT